MDSEALIKEMQRSTVNLCNHDESHPITYVEKLDTHVTGPFLRGNNRLSQVV